MLARTCRRLPYAGIISNTTVDGTYLIVVMTTYTYGTYAKQTIILTMIASVSVANHWQLCPVRRSRQGALMKETSWEEMWLMREFFIGVMNLYVAADN